MASVSRWKVAQQFSQAEVVGTKLRIWPDQPPENAFVGNGADDFFQRYAVLAATPSMQVGAQLAVSGVAAAVGRFVTRDCTCAARAPFAGVRADHCLWRCR